MSDENRISIVTVCDNHFSVLLAALLKSLELNHHSGELIDIFIVSDKISSKNKEYLNKSISTSSILLHWLDMQQVIPPRWTIPVDNSSFPLNVYVRLFIPYFIPEHLDKILFLDADMIVLKDISDLWKTDMSNHIIAGVVDKSKVVSSTWGGIPNYKELGLDPQTKYFNAGLQLINPKKWRDLNYTDQLMEIGRVNKEHVKWGDQYYLNVAFANKWLELDARWNWYAVFEHQDPYIIHFVGTKPIYASYNYVKSFKDEFYKYLSLTPYKNPKPISEFKRNAKKYYNLIEKKLSSIFK